MEELDAIFGGDSDEYDEYADEDDDVLPGFAYQTNFNKHEVEKSQELQEKSVGKKFVGYIKNGLVSFLNNDDAFVCPMSVSANNWRKAGDNFNPAAILSESIPICKGNSNGFADLNAFYQHFKSRGLDCETHAAIAEYLAKTRFQEITHIPKDPFTGKPLSDADFGKMQLRFENLGIVFHRTEHGDHSRKIAWPPYVIITNIAEKKFNSKTKILSEFAKYGAQSAAAKYGRGRGGTISEFKGEIIVQFPKTFEGYFWALELVKDIGKGEFKPSKAQLANIYHLMDRENMMSYSKVLKGWESKIYREVVYNPCLQAISRVEAESIARMK